MFDPGCPPPTQGQESVREQGVDYPVADLRRRGRGRSDREARLADRNDSSREILTFYSITLYFHGLEEGAKPAPLYRTKDVPL